MSGTALLVRRAGQEDVAQWAALRHALWPGAPATAHEVEVAAAQRDGILKGWLAFAGDLRAVGFAEVSVRRYANGATGSPVPFLEGIWIAPEYRRRGLGARLIASIAADCAAEGFIELCSDADFTNVASHRAHERWGFEETERVVYFRKTL